MLQSKIIKDPLYGFVEFSGHKEIGLKALLDSSYLQRLRRVHQLGFSDFVFPSATHSRFSHSIGVYHIAKRMLSLVEPDKVKGDWTKEGQACLAAALLHDVGHGMFSHAFEKAMTLFFDRNPELEETKQPLKQAVNHEEVSKNIINSEEISEILFKSSGNDSGFVKKVTDFIEKKDENCIYTSIVSSQLDADRLDYAKRDPYFAGLSFGGVDLDWIIRNFNVEKNKESRFFCMNSKAYVSLEQFTVNLFQLYPTIYLHKKTRGMEYLFSVLMSKVMELIYQGSAEKCGISKKHPLVKFFDNPGNLKIGSQLDDALFWGSLHSFADSDERDISRIARAMLRRKIPPHIDVWKMTENIASADQRFEKLTANQRTSAVNAICKNVCKDIKKDKDVWQDSFYYDTYDRPIYKPKMIMGGHPQQINVKNGGNILDIAQVSPLVASAATFNIHRIYYDEQLSDISRIEKKISDDIRRSTNLIEEYVNI